MGKVISWIVLLAGIYEILSLLVGSIPAVLEGTWGWIVGIVLVILGGYLLNKG